MSSVLLPGSQGAWKADGYSLQPQELLETCNPLPSIMNPMCLCHEKVCLLLQGQGRIHLTRASCLHLQCHRVLFGMSLIDRVTSGLSLIRCLRSTVFEIFVSTQLVICDGGPPQLCEAEVREVLSSSWQWQVVPRFLKPDRRWCDGHSKNAPLLPVHLMSHHGSCNFFKDYNQPNNHGVVQGRRTSPTPLSQDNQTSKTLGWVVPHHIRLPGQRRPNMRAIWHVGAPPGQEASVPTSLGLAPQ